MLEKLQSLCRISWMIGRSNYTEQVRLGLTRSPIVTLIGPRQCGKTTLARTFLPSDSGNYFDLEDPVVAALLEQPMTTLGALRGLVVIDEAQRRPELFPVLRVLADRPERPATFLLLGSASPELVEMRGFDLREVGSDQADTLWVRGGFPRSFLAADEAASWQWRRDFIRLFLERDLGVLGFGMAPPVMGRFWTMLSHYHGQLWNATEVAASLGVAPNTARSYLDALEQTLMIRRLAPWHANLGKRLVKSPKLYFRDSGLFHALQGIASAEQLRVHPKLGASWEGFALEEVLRVARPDEAWFYATHGGAELDLFMRHGGRKIGVEFKREDAPRLSRSMRTALEDLALDRLWVVYPGTRRYALHDHVEALPMGELLTTALLAA
jgi:uncharacterized protein